MTESDVVACLSDIHFSVEKREKVAQILTALIGDQISREVDRAMDLPKASTSGDNITVVEPASATQSASKRKSPRS